MKFNKSLCILSVVALMSLSAQAEEIYKSVDKSGAASFSDKKSVQSEQIRVNPNVIRTHVPVMPEAAVTEKSKQAPQRAMQVQPEVVKEGGGSTYGYYPRRNIPIRKGRELAGGKRPLITQPIRKRPAVRPSGARMGARSR